MQLAIDIPALGGTPLLGSSEKLLLLRDCSSEKLLLLRDCSSEKLLLLRLGGRHVRLLEDLGLSKQLRTRISVAARSSLSRW